MRDAERKQAAGALRSARGCDANAFEARHNPHMQATTAVEEHEDGVGTNTASLVRRWLDAVRELTGYDVAYWTVVDVGAGRQQVLVSRGGAALSIPEGLTVPWSETLCRRACIAQARVHEDIAESMPEAEAALMLGIRAYAMAPIEVEGRLEGTVCLASATPRALVPGADKVLEAGARMIAALLTRDRELAALRHRQAELARAALLDPLTGLANRRALFKALDDRLARGQVRLAFVDLDGFKAINDRFGHPVGDRFLVEVGRRLRGVGGEALLVARYAGDEFALLSDPHAELGLEAWQAEIADRLRGSYRIGAIELDYDGASVGVVDSEPGDTPERVLARADQAMYRIKRQRRD